MKTLLVMYFKNLNKITNQPKERPRQQWIDRVVDTKYVDDRNGMKS